MMLRTDSAHCPRCKVPRMWANGICGKCGAKLDDPNHPPQRSKRQLKRSAQQSEQQPMQPLATRLGIVVAVLVAVAGAQWAFHSLTGGDVSESIHVILAAVAGGALLVAGGEHGKARRAH